MKSADEPKHDKTKQKGTRELSQKMTRGKIITIAIIAAAIICGCFLLNKYIVNPQTFPASTTINGIDVSGLTSSQAEQKLTDTWNNKTIKIVENGRTIGTIGDLDLKYSIGNSVEKCLHPGVFKAIGRSMNKSSRKYTVTMTPASYTANVNRQFQELDIVENGKGTITTRNAYVDMSNTSFNIVKEVYGNNLNEKKLKNAIFKSLADNDTTFTYVSSKYYTKPSVKSNNKHLLARQKYCRNYLTTRITYNAPLKTYTIKPVDLDKMISVDGDGNITVNESAVKTFVAKLAASCNSVGATRTRKSVSGGTYTVTGGTYGFTIDKTKEATQLIKDLKTGKDVTRKPIYSTTGKGTVSGNDIGSSYIEVNISSQHMWCVINGKTVVSTDVTTGNKSKNHSTPSGTYYIVYKSRNATLKGTNYDGTKYESKVKYWMPFYLGDGFHDAWWRSKFGGTIYKNNGSHGCVNMPSAQAAKLYTYVYSGLPVVIHY